MERIAVLINNILEGASNLASQTMAEATEAIRVAIATSDTMDEAEKKLQEYADAKEAKLK